MKQPHFLPLCLLILSFFVVIAACRPLDISPSFCTSVSTSPRTTTRPSIVTAPPFTTKGTDELPTTTARQSTTAPFPSVSTPSSTTAPVTAAPPTELRLSDVPYICQKPRYPNGCESVSTVMALQFWGINITVDTFIDEYLPRGSVPQIGGEGPDPALLYGGDPRSSKGWGCYAPVIVKALKTLLDPTAFSVLSSDTMTLPELCANYLDSGYPVILWGLYQMRPQTAPWFYASWMSFEGKPITYHLNTHCLLLVGYDENNYVFHDPLIGAYVPYPKESCERSFALLGSQSIVLVPQPAP